MNYKDIYQTLRECPSHKQCPDTMDFFGNVPLALPGYHLVKNIELYPKITRFVYALENDRAIDWGKDITTYTSFNSQPYICISWKLVDDDVVFNKYQLGDFSISLKNISLRKFS